MRRTRDDVHTLSLQNPLGTNLPPLSPKLEPYPANSARRVSINLPLEISGTDLYGLDFIEKAGTRTISPHGASIVLVHTLVPEREITIRIASKRREFVARVVGQIGVDGDGNIYGVACVDPQPNLWGICFPPIPDHDTGLIAIALRCTACSAHTVVPLNDIEMDVLRRSEALLRHCHTCNQSTLWKSSADCDANDCPREIQKSLEPDPPAASPAAPKERQNQRKKSRVKVRMTGCVITPCSNEDIVSVTDVSTGGLRFVSKQKYSAGHWLRVAVPYTAGTTNIFMEARVVWARLRDGVMPNEYGLKYIKSS